MIYKGSQKQGKIYNGGTKIGKIYKGSQLVYQSLPKVPVYGAYAQGSLTVTWYMIGNLSTSDYQKAVNGSNSNLGTATITAINGTLGQSNSTVTISTTVYNYHAVKIYNNVKVYAYTNIVWSDKKAANDFKWLFVQEKSKAGDKCLSDSYGATDYLNQGIDFFMHPASVNETTIVIRVSRNNTVTKTRNQIKNYWWTRSGVILMS